MRARLRGKGRLSSPTNKAARAYHATACSWAHLPCNPSPKQNRRQGPLTIRAVRLLTLRLLSKRGQILPAPKTATPAVAKLPKPHLNPCVAAFFTQDVCSSTATRAANIDGGRVMAGQGRWEWTAEKTSGQQQPPPAGTLAFSFRQGQRLVECADSQLTSPLALQGSRQMGTWVM